MFTEKSGKTIHLLKQGTKPITPRKKRKTIPVLGTFTEYKESKQKPVPPVGVHQPQIDQMLAPIPNINQAAKEEPKKK